MVTAQLERLVIEALDRVAAPEARDFALGVALANAGREALPRDVAGLVRFVREFLYTAIDQVLGADVAEALEQDLAPFLQQFAPPEGAAAHDSAQGVRAGRLSVEPPESSPAPPEEGLSLDDLDDDVTPPKGTPVAAIVPAVAAARGRAEPAAAPARPPVPAEAVAPAPAPTPSLPRPPTVLLVDDDFRKRTSRSRALRAGGYEVVAAPDGHVALALCVRHRPDVVVAKLALPTVGGDVLASLLKVAFGAEAPPLVILTEGSIEPKSDTVAAVVMSASDDATLIDAIAPLIATAPVRC
ncbi:MAG: response regulator [Deltaproteobacteria bacterium]|nr:response regulator [Deltaproteobacteria bacterium]